MKRYEGTFVYKLTHKGMHTINEALQNAWDFSVLGVRSFQERNTCDIRTILCHDHHTDVEMTISDTAAFAAQVPENRTLQRVLLEGFSGIFRCV